MIYQWKHLEIWHMLLQTKIFKKNANSTPHCHIFLFGVLLLVSGFFPEKTEKISTLKNIQKFLILL